MAREESRRQRRESVNDANVEGLLKLYPANKKAHDEAQKKAKNKTTKKK